MWTYRANRRSAAVSRDLGTWARRGTIDTIWLSAGSEVQGEKTRRLPLVKTWRSASNCQFDLSKATTGIRNVVSFLCLLMPWVCLPLAISWMIIPIAIIRVSAFHRHRFVLPSLMPWAHHNLPIAATRSGCGPMWFDTAGTPGLSSWGVPVLIRMSRTLPGSRGLPSFAFAALADRWPHRSQSAMGWTFPKNGTYSAGWGSRLLRIAVAQSRNVPAPALYVHDLSIIRKEDP